MNDRALLAVGVGLGVVLIGAAFLGARRVLKDGVPNAVNPLSNQNAVYRAAGSVVRVLTDGAEETVGGVAARVREALGGDDARIRAMLKGSPTTQEETVMAHYLGISIKADADAVQATIDNMNAQSEYAYAVAI